MPLCQADNNLGTGTQKGNSVALQIIPQFWRAYHED
jgi:hypothetical protein